MKAKIKKTADARVRARGQNSPNATTHSTIGARSTRLTRKGQQEQPFVNPIYRKPKHKYTHTTKNRLLVKKVQQKEAAANILFKEKPYFRKKTDHLLALRPFGGAILLARSRHSPRNERRNATMPFFNPSIYPNT